jgi:MraZ protein
MFRGSFPARIDEKSRLKVPKDFRSLLEERFGREVFVTSVLGDCVRIYPLTVWAELEQKLGSGELYAEPAAQRFFQRSNYYGQVAEIDNQGRLLIHQRLRDAAGMNGEVDVVGGYNYLEVWNHDRLASKLERETFTDDDLKALSRPRG